MRLSMYEMDQQVRFDKGLKKAKAEGIKEGEKIGIQNLIKTLTKLNIAPTVIKQELREQYHLTDAEIQSYMK